MDELVQATGLGKATVYRLFATKDDLIGAYLERTSSSILGLIDADIERHGDDPRAALRAIFKAIDDDVRRPGFRGCAFNNASIEFADPDHPARIAARDYRVALHARLRLLARQIAKGRKGETLASQLALVIDGMYTNAAHLGAGGPAASGRALAKALIDDA
jgi:AcrR family transcriptional regulator